MSNSRHFVRQLVTSLTKKKANTPSPDNSVLKIHKNMTLKHCSPMRIMHRSGSALASTVDGLEQIEPEAQRPMTVMLTWLAAQEKHVEKYRAIWIERGFDVLTVTLNRYQLMLPTRGSHLVIEDLIKFLYSISPQYPDLVFHCFSVGGYKFGEMLTRLKDDEFLFSIKTKSGDDPREMIQKSIKGLIFDSAVDMDGIPYGTSQSISTNPLIAKPIETAIRTHMKLMYPIATKYYEMSSKNTHASPLTHAPALMMYSNRDKIGNPQGNERLGSSWEKRGINVTYKNFDKSAHVQHFIKYPKEYLAQIDNFLSKLSLTTRQ
ncbi:hypothetical protein HDE_04501 [Halotydeus destructor]|nr:hypothetical protein HDE_04501 [Halotydeus destructor]